MPASRNDQAVLGADLLFIGRVRASLRSSAVSIGSEATSTSFHYKRAAYAVLILNDINAIYEKLFALSVATDVNVIADATAGGTVVLTPTNIDTQQALITDAHIDAAVSGQFNSFFSPV